MLNRILSEVKTSAALLAIGLAAWSAAVAQAEDTLVPPTPPDPVVVVELPAVELLATDPTALSGTSTASFTLLRSGEPSADLVVNIKISGSASNGVDYVKIPEVVKIPKDALAVDIPIQPIFDAARRGNKSVILNVISNETYRLVAHKKATVTIVDDIFNDLPPKVELVMPAAGAAFNTPGIIKLQAQASDADGAIDRVTFFADDRVLGKVANGLEGLFELSWTNPVPGRYSLFARAVDKAGKATLSEPIQITVNSVPPTLKLVSPVNDASFSVPQDIPIKLEFTDAEGIGAKVWVYGDGKLLGTVTTSPGLVTWTNAGYGKHAIYARLKDELEQSVSAASVFTVANLAPAVELTSPAAGANFTAPASITLKASASDPGDTIKSVTFWSNDRLIGSGKLADNAYTFDWLNVKAGVYSVYALAMDSHGAKAKSKVVKISVSR